MITRREWLRKGATVVIGGTAVVVGGRKTEARPRTPQLPLTFSLTGIFCGAGPERLVNVDLRFEPDGSFEVVPLANNPDYDFFADDSVPAFLDLPSLRTGADAPVWSLVGALLNLDYGRA